jgi:DNA repair exonuclease SbcCD ATPase subunit
MLKELDRMNSNFENLRSDFDDKFREINDKLSDVKSTKETVSELRLWQEKVNEVWSPTQMKEAKDELYKQKNRWTATVAILAFIQIIIGIIVSLKTFL